MGKVLKGALAIIAVSAVALVAYSVYNEIYKY